MSPDKNFFTAKAERQAERQGKKEMENAGKNKDEIEEIAAVLVDAMIRVHKELGPGLLESTYQACLAYELRKRGLKVACEVDLPVYYDGMRIEAGYRIDMLVEDCIVVENKSAQSLPPIFEAQLMTYLKLSGLRLGFLVNWNVLLIKEGFKRRALNL